MANRRPQNNMRRGDFGRNDQQRNNFPGSVSPWQGGGPGAGLQNLLPLSGGNADALTLATNLIQMLQPRSNPVPSLLDMPVRRDFGPNMGPRINHGFGPLNRMGMGNQNFRRSGNFNNRSGGGGQPYRNRNQNQPRTQSNSKPYVKKEADKSKTVTKESNETKEIKKEPEEATEADTTETKEPAKTPSKDKDNKDKKTRYDDISPALLKCHICNKSMWDGRSFENHLSGRAHSIMMQKTAESYALTADTMRQEFKIREMKRTRKSGGQSSRDFYCAMCDMYAPDGAVHRTTIGHRKLKKYLHPACLNCHKEMPTRIELDEHRLTAEHLRNIQDKQDFTAKPKPEMLTISTLSTEQSYVRDDKRMRRHNHKDAEKDNQNNEDKEMEVEGSETKAKDVDNDDTVIDYKEGDDLSTLTKAQWPVYKLDRGVGRSFVEEFKCYQCKLCRKLLDTEETAEVHLKTWRHHQLFVKLLQEKTKKEEPETNGKRHLATEDDGNSKRRRTSDEEKETVEANEEEVDQANGDVEGEVEGQADEEMPAADQLEDWDNNEGGEWDDQQEDNQTELVEEEAEPEPEPEPTPEPEPEPEPQMVPLPEEYAPSPRTQKATRGRGSARARRARR